MFKWIFLLIFVTYITSLKTHPPVPYSEIYYHGEFTNIKKALYADFNFCIRLIKNSSTVYYTPTFLSLNTLLCVFVSLFIPLYILTCEFLRGVRYINFNTNLNLLNKEPELSADCFPFLKILSSFTLYFLVFDNWLIVFIPREEISNLILNKSNTNIVHYAVKRISPNISTFYSCLYRFTSIILILILKIMFLWCSTWLTFIKIILSNDVETNPGDLSNGFFTFCNWNLNSLAKDDFYRIRLLEADNSIFNNDIISICETRLNDSINLPDVMLENYSFIPSKKTHNFKHGGVGLFHKNTLPVKIREDL